MGPSNKPFPIERDSFYKLCFSKEPRLTQKGKMKGLSLSLQHSISTPNFGVFFYSSPNSIPFSWLQRPMI